MRPESWLKVERRAMAALTYVRVDGCDTCSELGPETMGECPKSERICGHHCNCVWVHDHCHWCDMEVDEDGTWPDDRPPAPVSSRVLIMALSLALALTVIVAMVASAL